MLVSFLLGATALGTGQLTAWGIVVFGEQVRGGMFVALTLIPFIALVSSVFLLSRSPVLQSTAGESPGKAPEGSDNARDEQGAAATP